MNLVKDMFTSNFTVYTQLCCIFSLRLKTLFRSEKMNSQSTIYPNFQFIEWLDNTFGQILKLQKETSEKKNHCKTNWSFASLRVIVLVISC